MEPREALQRIVGRHRRLIAAAVLLGGLIGFLAYRGQPPLYAATSRLVLDVPDPQSADASQAIADTVRALATGPALVRSALAHDHLRRDPLTVSRHEVSAESLGLSGVVALTVTDRNPRAAVMLANSLANGVIEARRRASGAALAQTISQLDRQIASLNGQWQRIADQINTLNSTAATASRSRLGQIQAQRAALEARQSTISQSIAILESERTAVTGDAALRPQASVVDPAIAPALAVPSRHVQDAGLGILLGLLVGVGLAALLEMARPTIVGRPAVEREIGAPVIAELVESPDRVRAPDLPALARRLALAARAAQLDRVELVGVDATVDLVPLARRLNGLLDRLETGQSDLPVVTVTVDASVTLLSHGIQRRSFVTTAANGHRRAGLVIVTPTVFRREALESAAMLASISGWPVLGIVVHPSRSRGLTLRRRRPVLKDRAATAATVAGASGASR